MALLDVSAAEANGARVAPTFVEQGGGMAHEIENDSDFGYAANEGKAWHGRGRPFPGGGLATPREAQRFILPWRVLEEPVVRPTGEIVTSRKSLVRSDTGAHLSVVGIGHTPLAHEDVAAILTDIFGELPCVDTCGALRGGARTWFLVKLANAEFTVGRADDRLTRYMIVMNPMDGTSSVVLKVVTVRVVCANTMSVALDEETTEFRVKHTPGVRIGTEVAAKILANEYVSRTKLQAFLTATRERQMTAEEWKNLLALVIPGDSARAINRRGFLTTLFEAGTATAPDGSRHTLDGAELDGTATAFRALNVISQDGDRSRPVRAGTDRRMDNLFGVGTGARNLAVATRYLKGLLAGTSV